jgi:Domain of unknown function (DUF6924)
MMMLPQAQSTLLVRTDFADETAWEALKEALATPSENGYLAYFTVIEDRAYQDLTTEQMRALVPLDHKHRLLVLVDRITLADKEMPLLVIDLFEHPGGEIRVIPAEFWSIENNLSQANLDFADFARRVGADGVFRGF